MSTASLVVNGVDLLLTALNNARRKAEQGHDWDCTEVTASGSAVLGVGDWKTGMTLYPSGGSISLKQPTTFYIVTTTGDLLPLVHKSKRLGASLAKEYLDRGAGELRSRYNGDYMGDSLLSSGTLTSPSSLQVYLAGNGKYTIEPRPTVNYTVVIDGYRWLDDYDNDNDTDWFTQHGAEYLQWQGIIEVNYLTQTFVPQQEGSLPVPVKLADQALMALIAYDNFIVEGGAFS